MYANVLLAEGIWYHLAKINTVLQLHRINDFRIGGLFAMPKNDFLDKNSFNKTSSMINLCKRAEIESP